MKLFPCLILPCLALGSSLMADEPFLHEIPDLNETEVDERVEELAKINFGNDVHQLSEMEVNDETIESILQNKAAKGDAPSINAPLVIRSMEDAAKHLNRASMELLDVDFEGQELVIFAWKGSDEDKLLGYYRKIMWLEANFHYIQGGLPARHKGDDLFGNNDMHDKAMPDRRITRIAVFVLAKHTQIRVRELSAPFGRAIACE